MFWSIVICVVTIVVVGLVLILVFGRKNSLKFARLAAKVDRSDSRLRHSDLYHPSKSESVEFERRVKTGRKHALQRAIVFSCVLTGSDYQISVARMYSLGRCFRDFRILLARHRDFKSEDLEKKKDDRLEIIDYSEDFSGLSPSNPRRSEIIAEIRNRLLTRALDGFRSFDYYCVFDPDVRGQFLREGFFECLSYVGWHAMACNGVRRKITAGEKFDFIQADVENLVGLQEEFPMIASPEFKKKLLDSMHPFPFSGELIPVRSYFGGCILYPLRTLSGCRYSADYPEHASLHQWMEDSDLEEIFVNPRWVVFHN